MRRTAALLIVLLSLAGCTAVQPAHRQALQSMQPISDPLVERLMSYDIPHIKKRPGSAKQ